MNVLLPDLTVPLVPDVTHFWVAYVVEPSVAAIGYPVPGITFVIV